MKFVALLSLLALVAVCLSNPLPINSDDDIVAEINNRNVGWTAQRSEFSISAAQKLLGVRDSGIRLPQKSLEGASSPPAFDSRQQWPGCIGPVLNQGDCGSCWAFGTAETLSDRYCIHSNGSVVVALAPLDITTCDMEEAGCDGGDPAQAWTYAHKTGVVTEACAPYNKTIPTCPPTQQPCLNFVPTPKCPSPKCANGASWSQDKHFAASAYSISSNIDDIQAEMFTNGPVQASFDVYADFVHYKSGVYRHVTGKYLGGHSVKIIGYGTMNATDYWLVQNSWTTTWGDNGYFMILRGKDECGIEDGIVAGLPKLQ